MVIIAREREEQGEIHSALTVYTPIRDIGILVSCIRCIISPIDLVPVREKNTPPPVLEDRVLSHNTLSRTALEIGIEIRNT